MVGRTTRTVPSSHRGAGVTPTSTTVPSTRCAPISPPYLPISPPISPLYLLPPGARPPRRARARGGAASRQGGDHVASPNPNPTPNPRPRPHPRPNPNPNPSPNPNPNPNPDPESHQETTPTAPLDGAHAAHAHAHGAHASAHAAVAEGAPGTEGAEGAAAAAAGARAEVSGPVRGGSRAEPADGRGRRAAGSLLRRRHS